MNLDSRHARRADRSRAHSEAAFWTFVVAASGLLSGALALAALAVTTT